MRRAPALRPLSDDHHGALVLARRCRRIDPQDAAAEAVRQEVLAAWTAELAPHFAIEEEALLPALEALGEEGFAARIREDHEALRALRDRAAAGEALAATLRELGRRLEDHVRYEEREVFAAVQERLTPAQREALGRAIAAYPRGGAAAGPASRW